MINCIDSDDVDRTGPLFSSLALFFMSVRLYVGNLPQNFESKELEAQLASVGDGIRFKAVLDRETGGCRGFGFANVETDKVADALIEQFNGKDFNGNTLRVERSERRESNPAGGGSRRGGSTGNTNASPAGKRSANKVVHSDAPAEAAPDPRWAGDLAKLKSLLADQKTAV